MLDVFFFLSLSLFCGFFLFFCCAWTRWLYYECNICYNSTIDTKKYFNEQCSNTFIAYASVQWTNNNIKTKTRTIKTTTRHGNKLVGWISFFYLKKKKKSHTNIHTYHFMLIHILYSFLFHSISLFYTFLTHYRTHSSVQTFAAIRGSC